LFIDHPTELGGLKRSGRRADSLEPLTHLQNAASVFGYLAKFWRWEQVALVGGSEFEARD